MKKYIAKESKVLGYRRRKRLFRVEHGRSEAEPC